MIRRGFLIFAFSLLAWAAPAGAQARKPAAQKLTLDQARAIALARHPGIGSAQYLARAAKATVGEARSSYFPLAYGSITTAGSIPSSRIAAGALNNPVIYNRYSNGVAVSQLVTDFGRTGNLVESARLRARAAEENVEVSREDVLLAVTRAYFAALRAQAVLAVAQKTVSERELVARQVEALERNKLKSGLDLSFANVNLAEARLFLAQSEGDVEASYATLSAALGYPSQRSFELAEAEVPGAPPAMDALVSQALAQRPDLSRERYSAESLRKFARAERDLWFPTINTVAAAGVTPYHQAALADRYAAAGLNINIPIFNGRLFNQRRAEADLRAKAETENLRALEDQVARDVRIAWLNAKTAFDRLALTRQLLDQANLALKLAQGRYDLGLGSIVELSQAQLSQTQAEIEQTSAKYDYQIQSAVLNYEIGQLP
jgi:outer membrane protein